MKFIGMKVVIACLTLVLASNATAALISNTDGQLVGATNVEVAGSFFDVNFLTGSCISVLNGCTETSDFFWTNNADADNASRALLEHVFTDVSIGKEYDSMPELTFGCTSTISCLFYTPFTFVSSHKTTINSSIAYNNTDNTLDGIGFSSGTTRGDRSRSNGLYAVWSAVEVPEPSTLVIVALGMIGLASRPFKKQA